MRNSKGFTLIELIVAMAIFMVIMIIASYAFERVLNVAGQQSRSAQSNFEGVVGLEMLRYDVEHAGYGLAYRFEKYTSDIKFRNLGGTNDAELVEEGNMPGFDSTSLNAVRANNIPPFGAGTSSKEANGETVTNPSGGPDYLVIRSTISSLDDSTKKWNYITYAVDTDGTTNLSHLKLWNNGDDLSSKDRIISIKSTFTSDGAEDKVLMQDDSDNFEYTLSSAGEMPAGQDFKPGDGGGLVVAYGLRSATASPLRMPYNRTDYYVTRPASGMAGNCNPGTGILYKSMVSHATGGFDTAYPLMDCIGDMQVEFEYDPKDDGNISPLSPAQLTALTAAEIRAGLKNIRIYILTHEGKMDKSYNYPGDSIHVGDPARPTSSGRTLSASEMSALFTSDWRKYRWKIYTMVTRPKNLAQ